MLKIRRPLGRLIFNMGIAIPGKTVFLIETAPRVNIGLCQITQWKTKLKKSEMLLLGFLLTCHVSPTFLHTCHHTSLVVSSLAPPSVLPSLQSTPSSPSQSSWWSQARLQSPWTAGPHWTMKIMISWHGNDFRIAVHLWGESTGLSLCKIHMKML